MARTPRQPAHRRNHKKTSPGKPPNEAALEDNEARLEDARLAAAAEAARLGAGGRLRNNLGQYIKENAVHLAEPVSAPKPARPASGWRRRGSSVPDIAPTALPEPFDHPLNQAGKAVAAAPTAPVAKAVTLEPPPKKVASRKQRKATTRSKRHQSEPQGRRLFIGLILLLGLFTLGYALYSDYTSLP